MVRNLRFLFVLLAILGAGGAPARADVPLPARLSEPATPAEAWNVVRLALANAERLFRENRVEEVTDQVVLLGPSLRLLSREGALPEKQEEAGGLAMEGFALINLLVRESMLGNLEGARTLFGTLQDKLGNLAKAFAPTLPETEVFSCVDHPEVAEADASKPCSHCGKELRPRRFPYSAIHTGTESPVLKLEHKPAPTLERGREVTLTFRLTTSEGAAVTESDLVLLHSRRLHLLLVSTSGEDFQHLAPEPGNEPGTYQTTFVPTTNHSYRAWVLVIPASTRVTETHAFSLSGGPHADLTPPPLVPSGELSVTRADLVARLVFPGPGPARLQARVTQRVEIHVTDSRGQPVTRLEPLWNAFAHLTLVSADLGTASQVHPIGGELRSETLRGGPTLSFKLHPPKPGPWWLFIQLCVDGRVVTLPLAVEAQQ